MDSSFLIGVVIVVLIALYAGRIFSTAIKVLFYLLIFVFLIVLVFGVSLNEVIDWALGVVLWAF